MTDRPRFDLRTPDGQGLVELIVALTILAVGVGALLTVLTASALSLQRSDRKGTALALAEGQIERYRNLSYSDLRLDNATLAAVPSTDPYVTANSSDPTIPTGTTATEVTTSSAGTNACASPLPPECLPIQTVTGPDKRSYRIDTYITSLTPKDSSGNVIGDPVVQVFVVVRDATISTLPILARSSSTFSGIDQASKNGKSITLLELTAPKAALTSTAISANSIVATLSGGTNPSGTMTFFVSKQSSAPTPPCTGAAWTQLGTANVNGNGAYSPSGGFTPSSAGTYYWYATYSGDAQNNQKVSTCGGAMAQMVVQSSKWSPTLTVSTTASTGITGTAISASAVTAALASSSGQTLSNITFMVYGPSSSAPGSCTTTPAGLWSQVDSITPSGDGSYNPNNAFTPTSPGTYWWYASFPGDSTNNAANGTCGSSMAKTVVSNPPDTFGFSTIGAQTAGNAFTANITAQLWNGLADTSYTGAQTLTFSGPASSPGGTAPLYQASVTFVSGVATGVTFTLYNAATSTITATQGLMTGSSNSFTVGAGTTAKLAVTTPSAQTAGVSFGTTLTATDAWGNTTTSYSGTKTISWSNPLSSPNGTAPVYGGAATSVPFVNGVGTAAAITLYNAASTTLKAIAGAYTGTSGTFTVGPASASSYSFGAIGTQAAGTAFSATLTAKDPYGNVDTNYAGSKSISWSGAANSPNGQVAALPGAVSFASGVGTGSGLILYKATSTTLTATTGSVSGSSSAFTVSSAPTQLTMSACGSNVKKSQTWTFTVTRAPTDAYGNSDSNRGSSVTVTPTVSQATVSPASLAIAPNTGTSGSFTITNTSTNNKTVTVSVAGTGYTTSTTCSYTTTN
jgi:Tfp pilus assembly protein PilV